MIIEIDTREKPKAIKKILKTFDDHGIRHISTKLYVGDYRDIENPMRIIDRKHSISELAQNATSGHDRFKRELSRLYDIGGEMTILVEQNRYKDVLGEWVTVRTIDDLIGWKNPYGSVNGVRVYKVLAAWQSKYNIRFEFCAKTDTGNRIIEILKG